VNTPLAALFELEMFDRVRDVYIRTVDTRLFERTAQQTAGRPDKWLPGKILTCGDGFFQTLRSSLKDDLKCRFEVRATG